MTQNLMICSLILRLKFRMSLISAWYKAFLKIRGTILLIRGQIGQKSKANLGLATEIRSEIKIQIICNLMTALTIKFRKLKLQNVSLTSNWRNLNHFSLRKNRHHFKNRLPKTVFLQEICPKRYKWCSMDKKVKIQIQVMIKAGASRRISLNLRRK